MIFAASERAARCIHIQIHCLISFVAPFQCMNLLTSSLSAVVEVNYQE